MPLSKVEIRKQALTQLLKGSAALLLGIFITWIIMKLEFKFFILFYGIILMEL